MLRFRGQCNGQSADSTLLRRQCAQSPAEWAALCALGEQRGGAIGCNVHKGRS